MVLKLDQKVMETSIKKIAMLYVTNLKIDFK